MSATRRLSLAPGYEGGEPHQSPSSSHQVHMTCSTTLIIITTMALLLVKAVALTTVLEDDAILRDSNPMSSKEEGRRGSVATSQLESVTLNPRYCKYTADTMTLFCDYKWEEQEVLLRAKQDVEMIIIKRLHHLTLDRSICCDLELYRVADAQLKGQPSISCSSMKVSLYYVTLDFLGHSVTNLYVFSSKVREVSLNSVKEQLRIFSSSIRVFKVQEVRGDVFVKVHNTTITHLERLHIKESAKLLLLDSVIDEVPAGALVLSSSGNTLSKVKFPTASDLPKVTLVLEPGADVTLQDVSGTVLVSCSVCSPPPPTLPQAPLDQQLFISTSPATVTHQKEECHCSHILLSVVVILTIIIITLICYIIVSKKSFNKVLGKMTQVQLM